MPSGRFNGQRFFLTYPQADHLSIDDVADHLHNLAPSWLEIVQEEHQIEGIHYHVVLCFESRYQGALDSFDVNGHHCNWQPIRNATVDLNNRRHYIRKGLRSEEEQHTIKSHKKTPCDYIIDPDTRGTVPPYSDQTGRLDWGGILAAATTEEEFLHLVRVNQPKEWVLRHDTIVKYGATQFLKAQAPEKVYDKDSWVIPPAMDDWVREVFSEVCFIPAHSHVPPLVN